MVNHDNGISEEFALFADAISALSLPVIRRWYRPTWNVHYRNRSSKKQSRDFSYNFFCSWICPQLLHYIFQQIKASCKEIIVCLNVIKFTFFLCERLYFYRFDNNNFLSIMLRAYIVEIYFIYFWEYNALIISHSKILIPRWLDLYRTFASSTLRSGYVETHPQVCSYRHLFRRMS